jgi:hypothetical protein
MLLLGGVLAREARAWKPLPNGICWRDCFSIDTAHQGGPQRRTARRYSTGLVGLVKMNTDPSSVSGRVVATSSIIVSFELSPWKLRTWRADNRMISMRSKRFDSRAPAAGTGRTAGATGFATLTGWRKLMRGTEHAAEKTLPLVIGGLSESHHRFQLKSINDVSGGGHPRNAVRTAIDTKC